MSDYGFVTLDQTSTGKITSAMNAKQPMIGFNMSHKPSGFFTVNISDAEQINWARVTSDSSYSAPTLPSTSSLYSSYYGIYDASGTFRPVQIGANKTTGAIRREIYKIKHGYRYRPACYAIFTGDLERKVNTHVVGTPVYGQYWFNGSISDNNWNLYNNRYDVTEETSYQSALFPFMNGMMDYNGLDMKSRTLRYYISASDMVYTTSTSNYLIKGVTSQLTSGTMMVDIATHYPYEVVVDDEYVRIYKNAYWADVYGRIYFELSSSSEGYPLRYRMSDYLRAQMFENYYGSSVNATIMLLPYKMEDVR